MALRESAFEVMRPYVSKALGISPKSLDPNARLDDLIPRCMRRQVWRDLEAAMGIRMPALWFSPVEILNVAALAAGMWLVAAGLAVYFDNRVPSAMFPGVVVLLMLFAPIAIGAADFILAQRATWLPNIDTLLELADATVRDNMRVFRTRYGVRPSRDEIFALVRAALVDALGVDECEVTPDARLVQDLGAG
jgi:hypothetical protein